MNGKFRTSISGFNRQDVLNYIKKLSEEKAALEKDNEALSDRLYDIGEHISQLTEVIAEKDESIAALNERLGALNAELEAVRETVVASEVIFSEITADLNSIKEKAADAKEKLEASETQLNAIIDANENI